MSKKLKAILYAILPVIMIMLCASMITYIFAATKSELRIEGQIGYERPKGTGTEEDPFLIYSIGPNDGTATLGSFNYYAGNNSTSTNYFSSSSPQYYFKQMQNLSGSDFTKTDLLGFYDGNDYSFTVSSGGGALFSSIGTSSVKTAKLYDLNVSNSDCGDDAGVVLSLYGTLDNVHFSGNNTNDRIGVGGLVENSYDGATILNCSNSATIEGGMYNADDYAGGIVGCVQGRTTIEKCHNTGNVSSYTVAGGVVGKALARCLMSNCSNSGEIYSEEYAGGVIGNIQCSDTFIIDYLCNSGSVTSMVCGGIVGSESCVFFEIYSSYNSGYIDGVLVGGGIIGNMYSHYTIQHTYNIGSIDTNIDTAIAGATLGISGVGGIIGCEQYNDFWSMSLENFYLSSCGPTTAVGSINGAIADDNTTERQGAWTKHDWHDMQNDMMFSTATGWNIQDDFETATEGFAWAGAEILIDGVKEVRYLLRLWFEDIEVLPTYYVTLNGNGGSLGQTTTSTKVPQSWSVSNMGGYSFTLNSSTGYYVSGNKGVNSSYSLAKVTFTANAGDVVTFSVINSGEANYDYGIFSNLNTTLTASYSADTTNVYKSYKGASSTSAVTLTYTIATSGSNYIYVKFIKDSSVGSGNDSLQFKIVESQGTTTTNLTTISQVVVEGGYIDVSNAKRDGYELVGFATSSSATTPQYTVTNGKFYPTAGGTLYAVWAQNTTTYYSVSAQKHNSSPSSGCTYSVSSSSVASGSSVTFTATMSSGYTFQGWYTSSSLTSTSYRVSTSTSYTRTITSNTTLYAYWTQTTSTYSVSAGRHLSSLSSGCSYSVSSSSVTSGTSVTFRATESSGYLFQGWYSSNILTGSLYKESMSTIYTKTITSNTTLYAYWRDEDTCLCQGCHETLYNVLYCETCANIETCISCDSCLSHCLCDSNPQAITVTASKHNSSPSSGCSYGVKLYGDSSTVSSLSVVSGSQVTFFVSAVYSGYTFKGWYSSSSSTSTSYRVSTSTSYTTTCSSNTTLYAYWTTATTYSCWCCGASSSSSTCSTCAPYGSCAACLKCNLHCTCAGYGGCACCGSSALYDGIHCYTCYNSAAHCDYCNACLHHPCDHGTLG